MRKWINLFENAITPEQLLKLARDLMYVNDDIFGEEFDEPADEADCLKIIEQVFHSANCDDFAQVCQEITGDQPYEIRYAHQHHTVLSLSDYDGPFYDVTGFVTLDEICRRYRFPKEHVEVLEGCHNCWLDYDDARDDIKNSIRYLKQIGRKPFNEFPI